MHLLPLSLPLPLFLLLTAATAHPSSGPFPSIVPSPESNPIDSPNYYFFSRTGALAQITTLCQRFRSNNLALNAATLMPGKEYDNLVQTESKDVTSGGTFTLSAVYAASACAGGMYGVDFAAMTLPDCELLFMKPVDQCHFIDQPMGDLYSKYWKVGGSWNASCGLFTVRAQ